MDRGKIALSENSLANLILLRGQPQNEDDAGIFDTEAY